jgi:predicted DNA-binding transcriptional regulator AlpA
VLTAGDVLALAISGQYQQVRVAHGGYRGWYFVTARGSRGRFALTETTSPPRLLTDKQVMDWLEISRTGLHYLMRRKGFPYVKLGESRRAPLRFSQQSVQEWLAQNEHRITA